MAFLLFKKTPNLTQLYTRSSYSTSTSDCSFSKALKLKFVFLRYAVMCHYPMLKFTFSSMLGVSKQGKHCNHQRSVMIMFNPKNLGTFIFVLFYCNIQLMAKHRSCLFDYLLGGINWLSLFLNRRFSRSCWSNGDLQ